LKAIWHKIRYVWLISAKIVGNLEFPFQDNTDPSAKNTYIRMPHIIYHVQTVPLDDCVMHSIRKKFRLLLKSLQKSKRVNSR